MIPWGLVLGPVARLLGKLIGYLAAYYAGRKAAAEANEKRVRKWNRKMRKKADAIDEKIASGRAAIKRQRLRDGADKG